MFVLPVGSIAVEVITSGTGLTWLLVCKWVVFWCVGIRLFVAGLRQTIQPRYTAHHILGLKGDEPLIVVRELGFANLSLGTLGICSLYFEAWWPAAALSGGIFYGLAGINHLLQPHRNQKENMAMVTDLVAAVVLLAAFVAAIRV